MTGATMKSNLVIAMSGGTTSVINSTLAGIIKAVQKSEVVGSVYGGSPGMQGILQGQLVDLTGMSSADLAMLRHTPGSGFIGTTRIVPLSDQDLEQLQRVFDQHDIGYFINIGGNGTIKQTQVMAAHFRDDDRVKVAAAPKTVDNDLGDGKFEKVFFTPGFPSCVNFWARHVQLLNLDNSGAYSHDRVLVSQTFGRETGFIAGAARISDPDRELPLLLLLPEDQQRPEAVMGRIDDMLVQHGRAIVIISEGYTISDVGAEYDFSGQIMYGSSRTTAAQLLVNACMESGIQARAQIIAMSQRLSIDDRFEFDLDIAQRLGTFIVEQFELGQQSFLASVADPSVSNTLIRIPFDEINDYSRRMPPQWIDAGQFDVTGEYCRYLNSLLDVSDFEKRYERFEGQLIQPAVAQVPAL